MADNAKPRPEQERVCNLKPSTRTETDWQFHNAVESGALGAPAILPASLDLREPWWDIGDQKNTGSCVGWGSTDGVARYMFATANRLANNVKLSPGSHGWQARRPTRSTTRPETMIEEAGTTLKAAVDILRNFGAAPETGLLMLVDR